MYRLLYSTLWYLLCPFILIRLFLRARKNPEYKKNWRQRFGHIHAEHKPRIWLHAVSVGETMAARPLIEAILAHYPHHRLLLSNTTPTGSQTAKRLFGSHVEHNFFPYDLPHAVQRFLDTTQPDILIIMETELWPNLLSQCQRRNIPVIIANARLSARSTQGYQRITKLITPAIQCITQIACRSEQDAQHFQQLGASKAQTIVTGNIKFDITLPTTQTTISVRSQLAADALVWVAASTHQGEDSQILTLYQTLKKQLPSLVLILVPRHPERFDRVHALCAASGFCVQRRSQTKHFDKQCEIILGDSLGEMALWYKAADVVFMGGSLVNTGGHNPLEASIFGKPVVSGPATFNFHDVFDLLCGAQVAWVAADTTALQKRVLKLLSAPPDERLAIAEQATQVLMQQRGVTQRLMKQIQHNLPH